MNNVIKRRTKKLSIDNLIEYKVVDGYSAALQVITVCKTQDRGYLFSRMRDLSMRTDKPNPTTILLQFLLAKHFIKGKSISRVWCNHIERPFWFIDRGSLHAPTILFIDGTVRIAPVYAVLKD